MPGNPLIPGGLLNRVKASVVWTDFPNLNVTAPFLDKDGITLRLEGESTMQHGTMVSIVQSGEPYMMASVVIALLRTQSLSDSYKAQMESNAILGACTIWPDVQGPGGISSYQLYNMAIQSVGELLLNGTTPIFGVTCRGQYPVNNDLFL